MLMLQKKNIKLFYLFLAFLLLSLPNLFLVFFGNDSITATLVKSIIFLIMGFSLLWGMFCIIPSKFLFWSLSLFIVLGFGEMYHIHLFQVPLSHGMIASFFQTTISESTELIEQTYGWLLGGIISIISFIAISSKIDFKPSNKTRIISLLTIFIFFLLIFIRDYQIAQSALKSTFKENFSLAWGNFTYKFEKIYPVSLPIKVTEYLQAQQKRNAYQQNIANFTFKAVKKDTLLEKEIYILIIGETARKANFSLYGYEKETNPLLKQDSVFAFSNAKTAANLTHLSLPFILSRSNPKTIEKQETEKSIIAAFGEANFQTYWITNQPYHYNNIVYYYTLQSNHFKSLNASFDLDGAYDMKLVPVLREILDKKEQKQFIILHTIGSHYRYNYRYPKSFEKFTPSLRTSKQSKQTLVNSYDNSILYTDFFLHNIIDLLRQQNCTAFLYYLSDHGENLEDDEHKRLLHGSPTPTHWETDIPLITWSSKKYQKNYPQKHKTLQKNISANISSTNTFHTLLDLANISCKDEQKQQSFADSTFEKNQKRYFQKVNGKMIILD